MTVTWSSYDGRMTSSLFHLPGTCTLTCTSRATSPAHFLPSGWRWRVSCTSPSVPKQTCGEGEGGREGGRGGGGEGREGGREGGKEGAREGGTKERRGFNESGLFFFTCGRSQCSFSLV